MLWDMLKDWLQNYFPQMLKDRRRRKAAVREEIERKRRVEEEERASYTPRPSPKPLKEENVEPPRNRAPEIMIWGGISHRGKRSS